MLKTDSAKVAKKPPAVAIDAIVPLMLRHHVNFGDTCAGRALVTNTGLDPGLSDFFQAIGKAPDIATLPEDARIAFLHVARGYAATTPPLAPSEADLFLWLRGLVAHTDRGQLEDLDAALLELADMVVNYSEIDLLQRPAKQIAREIVNQVRRKVAHSTTLVPASDDQLRRDKGLVVTEILSMLSLSTQAYELLRGRPRQGYGQDPLPAPAILPKARDDRPSCPDLRIQGALGYLAHNGEALREQRRLHAPGKARARPVNERL